MLLPSLYTDHPHVIGTFPSERIKRMRQGHPGELYAQLVTISTSLPRDSQLREKVIRPLCREFMSHDADGNPVKLIRERVQDVIDGQLCPAVITVLAVQKNVPIDELSLETARSCGHKTCIGLRQEWLTKHPKSIECHVIIFALGDVRDRPIFLNYTGRAGGDYTSNRARAMDEAEALTAEQLAALVSWNRQRDAARTAKAAAALVAGETLAERVERLERILEAGGERAKAVRQNLRVVEQRIIRAERRPQ